MSLYNSHVQPEVIPSRSLDEHHTQYSKFGGLFLERSTYNPTGLVELKVCSEWMLIPGTISPAKRVELGQKKPNLGKVYHLER